MNITTEEKSRPGFAIRLAISVLGIAGMSISGYLAYVHFQKVSAVCMKGFDCDSVLSSPYAEIWGVPLALFGFLLYVIITVAGFLLMYKKCEGYSLIALAVYSMALSGTIFSLYLVRMMFIMDAFCSWCLISDLIMFSILVFSIIVLYTGGLRISTLFHWKRIRPLKDQEL